MAPCDFACKMQIWTCVSIIAHRSCLSSALMMNAAPPGRWFALSWVITVSRCIDSGGSASLSGSFTRAAGAVRSIFNIEITRRERGANMHHPRSTSYAAMGARIVASQRTIWDFFPRGYEIVFVVARWINHWRVQGVVNEFDKSRGQHRAGLQLRDYPGVQLRTGGSR